MLTLPKELFKLVLSFLRLKDIANLALVNKQLHEATQQPIEGRDQLRSYITAERENLSSSQINFLLSEHIYSKLKNKLTTVEAVKTILDQSAQEQNARINALRYPMAQLQLEEQKQQNLAINKGYLEEELVGLTPLKRKGVLEHNLSVEQVKELRHDQVNLIIEKHFSYNDIRYLKAHQTDLLKKGWPLEKAKTMSVIDARMIGNKRKDMTESVEPDTLPSPKITKHL